MAGKAARVEVLRGARMPDVFFEPKRLHGSCFTACALRCTTQGLNSPGEIEVDESLIGSKARNMHAAKRERAITGTGGKDKEIALGMVEHGGKVIGMQVSNRRERNSQPHP